MARLLLVALAVALGLVVGVAMVAVGMDGVLSCFTGTLLAAGLAGVWRGRT